MLLPSWMEKQSEIFGGFDLQIYLPTKNMAMMESLVACRVFVPKEGLQFCTAFLVILLLEWKKIFSSILNYISLYLNLLAYHRYMSTL